MDNKKEKSDSKIALEKHKKLLKKFKISAIVLMFVIFLIEIIIINLFKDYIIVSGIICVIVMVGYYTTAMGYINAKNNQIIEKYYHTVIETDVKIANELLENEDLLSFDEYDFLKEDMFDEYDHDIKLCLNEISSGNKVDSILCQLCFKIKETISSNPYLYNNERYNEYIYKIVELLQRNIVDLELED